MRSTSGTAMKLMRVTVFLGETDAGQGATYTVVAASAWEAVKLILDYFNLREPWDQIDIDVLADGGIKGPARVLAPATAGSA